MPHRREKKAKKAAALAAAVVAEGGEAAEQVSKATENNETDRQGDRPASLFNKTKMCKFNLLGLCAKDLYRTKLCKELIAKGVCEDKRCQYAHNKDELRTASAFCRNRPCKFFQAGHCELGDRCNYMHVRSPGIPAQADQSNRQSNEGAQPQAVQQQAVRQQQPNSQAQVISLDAGLGPARVPSNNAQPPEPQPVAVPAVPDTQQVVIIDARTGKPIASGALMAGEMQGQLQVLTAMPQQVAQVPQQQTQELQQRQVVPAQVEQKPKAQTLPLQNNNQGQALHLHGKIISPADLPEAKPKYPDRISPHHTPAVKNPVKNFDPPPRSPVRTVRSVGRLSSLAEDEEKEKEAERERKDSGNQSAEPTTPKQDVHVVQHTGGRMQPSAAGQPLAAADADSNALMSLDDDRLARANDGESWVVRNTFLTFDEPRSYPMRPISSCMGRFDSLVDQSPGHGMSQQGSFGDLAVAS